jgi:glycerol-3-phosphate acyltransferase PlsX
VLRALKSRADPRRYNGASLVGLRGIVIKSHGSADQVSFVEAIKEAMVEVDKRVPERISNQVSAMLEERRAV